MRIRGYKGRRRGARMRGNLDHAASTATEPEVPQAARITVQDASEAFLAKCNNRNIAVYTLAKDRTFIN